MLAECLQNIFRQLDIFLIIPIQHFLLLLPNRLSLTIDLSDVEPVDKRVQVGEEDADWDLAGSVVVIDAVNHVCDLSKWKLEHDL